MPQLTKAMCLEESSKLEPSKSNSTPLDLRIQPQHLSNLSTMFRVALLRSAKQAVRAAPRCQAPIARPAARSFLFQAKPCVPTVRFQAVRCYSASASLSKDEIEGRIMDLLKNFDKVMTI
jgi:hypothetical protein